MFDTIVLATDGSDSAERAVTLALEFAETFDADLSACYVVSEDDDPEASRERGRAALKPISERADGVTTTLLKGDPAAEICTHAADTDADLVVTGTRGRGGEHGNLIGSVAEAVVNDSPAPVLTARQIADGTSMDVPLTGGNE